MAASTWRISSTSMGQIPGCRIYGRLSRVNAQTRGQQRCTIAAPSTIRNCRRCSCRAKPNAGRDTLSAGVNVDLGAFALRDAKSFPNMGASNDTMREIAKALRRHVDTATLEKVVNELLDVPGNRDFREAIEELARELLRR